MTAAPDRSRVRATPQPSAPSGGRSQEKLVRNSLICGALAVGLAAVAAPAQAQDSDSITVASRVERFCAALDDSGWVDMEIGDIVDAQGRVVADFTGVDAFQMSASYYCNSPSVVTLKAVPLTNADVPSVADAAAIANRRPVAGDYVGAVEVTVTATN